MKNLIMTCIALLFMLSLVGCGSGGGDGTVPPVTQPTSAVLKLSTTGTMPAGTSLAGVGVTIVLPAGVSVSTDTTGTVTAGVVTASGVAAKSTVIPPVFTPATATKPATLKLVVGSTAAGGFGVGEFATVSCNIGSGSFPKSTDFSLPAADIKVADLVLQPVPGITATVTAAIQ